MGMVLVIKYVMNSYKSNAVLAINVIVKAFYQFYITNKMECFQSECAMQVMKLMKTGLQCYNKTLYYNLKTRHYVTTAIVRIVIMTSRVSYMTHHKGIHSNTCKFNSSVYASFILQYFSDKTF